MTQVAVWADRCIDGEHYRFQHLRTHDLVFRKPAKAALPELTASIRVVFDCHVVTEKWPVMAEGPAFWLDKGGHCRRFNQQRYLKSFALPDIVAALVRDEIACYRARHRNYMVWQSPSDLNGDAPYLLFFDLYRSPREPAVLVLYVQSAYHKDNPGGIRREHRVIFGRLCAELLGRSAPEQKSKSPA